MRNRLLIPVAAIALAVGYALPAADTTAGTATTFTVSGGLLSITAPAAKAFGTGASGAALSSTLGAVQVTDARNSVAGWTASVTATDFKTSSNSAAETIGKANVDYWSGTGTTTGTAVFTPGQATASNKVDLGASRTAYSATGVVGNNSATWNPTVTVNCRQPRLRATTPGSSPTRSPSQAVRVDACDAPS